MEDKAHDQHYLLFNEGEEGNKTKTSSSNTNTNQTAQPQSSIVDQVVDSVSDNKILKIIIFICIFHPIIQHLLGENTFRRFFPKKQGLKYDKVVIGFLLIFLFGILLFSSDRGSMCILMIITLCFLLMHFYHSPHQDELISQFHTCMKQFKNNRK